MFRFLRYVYELAVVQFLFRLLHTTLSFKPVTNIWLILELANWLAFGVPNSLAIAELSKRLRAGEGTENCGVM